MFSRLRVFFFRKVASAAVFSSLIKFTRISTLQEPLCQCELARFDKNVEIYHNGHLKKFIKIKYQQQQLGRKKKSQTNTLAVSHET